MEVESEKPLSGATTAKLLEREYFERDRNRSQNRKSRFTLVITENTIADSLICIDSVDPPPKALSA